MKLKKLIPLAGIAGVAAVAAPLVSSCSEMATEFVWTPEDDVPEIKPVERTYTASGDSEGKLNAMLQATSDYFADLKNDKTLFAKEMINYWSNSEVIALINSTTVKTTKVNADDSTISYQINIQAVIPSENAKKNVIDFEITVKNVQFFVLPNDWTGLETGAMFAPVVVANIVARNQNASSVAENWLQEQLANVLTDDSWSIDFKQYNQIDDTTRTIHMDRSNVIDILATLFKSYTNNSGRTPSKPDIIIKTVLGATVYCDSTYLSKVKFESKGK